MKKSGNKYTMSLQERWVKIEGEFLRYYKRPADKVAQGSVNLTRCEAARMYEVSITCKTMEIYDDGRTYVFVAADNAEAKEWVRAINLVRKTSQESAVEAKKAKKMSEAPYRIRFFDENVSTKSFLHYLFR